MCDTCKKLEGLDDKTMDIINEIAENVQLNVEEKEAQYREQIILTIMRTLGVTEFRIPRTIEQDVTADLAVKNVELVEDGSSYDEFVFRAERLANNPTNTNPLEALIKMLEDLG
jgi:hypothetical protein